MKSHTKKLAVLHQLSQEADAINLQTLLAKLGGEYAERSVRRWLADMEREGLVEKIGKKRATQYKVIDRKDRQSSLQSSCFGSKSEKALQQIRRPLHERLPIAYQDDWFEKYRANVTFYLPLELRSQLHNAGKRSKDKDPAGTYARQIFNRLLIDLSYNSSRLEGNTYSLLDTQKLLLEGTSAEGKLDEEKIMILNHKEAIRYLVDTAPRLEINTQIICTLHYLLSDGLLESCYAGKVRDHSVRIGGSTYMPFEDTKQLQVRLDRIVKKAAKINDPYEQSLFLLIHISYLQAFSDVNKRTARLSSNIPLIKNNLVPLSFNDVVREDYTSAMIAVYELQNIHPILDLYVFSYMRTCALYDSTVKAIGYDEIRVRYRDQRRAVLREIIAKNFFGKAMNNFITQASRFVKKEDRIEFVKDLQEDLQEMDESRLHGLGVTPDQLKKWKDSQRS